MRTSILLGSEQVDANGLPIGPLKVISSPPLDDAGQQAQAKLFSEAREQHIFPKGIKYLAFCTVESVDEASFISAAVAEQVQARESNRIASIEAEYKKAEAAKKAQAAQAEAAKALSVAAVKHNNASAALQTAKNVALDAEAAFKQAKGEATKAALEAAQKKVAEATDAEAEARTALDDAKKTKAAAKK